MVNGINEQTVRAFRTAILLGITVGILRRLFSPRERRMAKRELMRRRKRKGKKRKKSRNGRRRGTIASIGR